MSRPRWGQVDLVRVDGQIRILDAPRWIAITTDLLGLLDPDVAVLGADGILTITAANRTVRYQRLGLLDLGADISAVEFERMAEPITSTSTSAAVDTSGRLPIPSRACLHIAGPTDQERAAAISEAVHDFYRRAGGSPAAGW